MGLCILGAWNCSTRHPSSCLPVPVETASVTAASGGSRPFPPSGCQACTIEIARPPLSTEHAEADSPSSSRCDEVDVRDDTSAGAGFCDFRWSSFGELSSRTPQLSDLPAVPPLSVLLSVVWPSISSRADDPAGRSICHELTDPQQMIC